MSEQPGMMVAWFPFIVVFFVLLMAGGLGGRVCRTRGAWRPAAPFALAVAAGLMLLLASLLLGGALLLDRPLPYIPPQPPVNVPQSQWLLPPPPPSEIPVELASEKPAERPEASDADGDSLSTPATVSQINQQSGSEAAASKPGLPRPAWMDADVGRIGDIYRLRITVGPYLSRAECEKDLPEALQKAVRDYATRHLGEEKAARVSLPGSYIDEHIVRGEWEERRQMTIDEFVYLHELLEFDVEAKRRIEASALQAVVNDRLMYTAAGGSAVLGLLTLLFAYLKLDTLTRGLYTWRLRLTATAAILAIALIAGLLVMA